MSDAELVPLLSNMQDRIAPLSLAKQMNPSRRETIPASAALRIDNQQEHKSRKAIVGAPNYQTLSAVNFQNHSNAMNYCH